MIIGAASARPVKFSVRHGDRMFVDGRQATAHEAVGIELPVLIAIGAKPTSAVVVEFIGKSHRDAIVVEFYLRVRKASISARPLMNSARMHHVLSGI